MAFCTQCGNQVTIENDRFCPKCGTQVQDDAAMPPFERAGSVAVAQVATSTTLQNPRIPMASIILAGVGLVVAALGAANLTAVFAHAVLTRLLYAAFGVGFLLVGVAVLVAFNWASARSLGTTAILIGVGLVLSGTWGLAIAIGLRDKYGNTSFPSNTIQNATSAVSMGGWVLAALGVFLTLKKRSA